MSLDEVLRFRCTPELKARFEKIAAQKRRDASDLARIVFEDYVSTEEQVLRDSPNRRPMPEPKPVSYGAKKTDPSKVDQVAKDIVRKAAEASKTRTPK